VGISGTYLSPGRLPLRNVPRNAHRSVLPRNTAATKVAQAQWYQTGLSFADEALALAPAAFMDVCPPGMMENSCAGCDDGAGRLKGERGTRPSSRADKEVPEGVWRRCSVGGKITEGDTRVTVSSGAMSVFGHASASAVMCHSRTSQTTRLTIAQMGLHKVETGPSAR
jgi:hypothetical protein